MIFQLPKLPNPSRSVYEQVRGYLNKLGGRREYVPLKRTGAMGPSYAERRALRTRQEMIQDVDDYVTVLEVALESGWSKDTVMLERDSQSYLDSWHSLARARPARSTMPGDYSLEEFLTAARLHVDNLERLKEGKDVTHAELMETSNRYREARSPFVC